MALDKGHEYADTELRKLEKKLEKEYTQALKDMEKKADAYFSRFKEQDAKQLALVQAGKITQDEYNKWRLNHMLTGERYNHFVESLAQDLTHTNEIAMSMLNPTLESAWAENYNYGGYEIAKGLNQNIAWELADHDTVERLIKDNPKLLPKPRVDIPKDKRWNQQKLKSALTQGIIQGESIKNISKRLQSVTDMSTSAAIRNARTATTGAENAGRMQSYEDAEELGIQMQKQWISTLDDRTRETHVLLDQEIVDTDEAFSNKLMYPGDPNGAPEEVYNCRCTMIGVLKKHPYKMDNRANKLGDMTYEEWKNQYTHGALIGVTGKNYTWEQSMDMQRILQNAPEDVRELWKQTQGEFSETIHERGDKAFYRAGENRVHLNEANVAKGDDLNPAYETHFHEYGHNIDYMAGGGSPISLSYRDSQGRTFEEIITQEWESKLAGGPDAVVDNFLMNLDTSKGGMGGQAWLKSGLRDWRKRNNAYDEDRYDSLFDSILAFSPDDKDGMLNFLKNNMDIFNDGSYTISGDALKNKILGYCAKIKKENTLEVRGNLSDMMERYAVKNAGTAYPLGAGHGKSYALESGRLAKETFAEMFSSEVCNKASLDLIKRELPESYKAFKDMVKGVLK